MRQQPEPLEELHQKMTVPALHKKKEREHSEPLSHRRWGIHQPLSHRLPAQERDAGPCLLRRRRHHSSASQMELSAVERRPKRALELLEPEAEAVVEPETLFV